MANSEEILLALIKVQDEIIVQSPAWYADLKAAIDNLIVNDFGKSPPVPDAAKPAPWWGTG